MIKYSLFFIFILGFSLTIHCSKKEEDDSDEEETEVIEESGANTLQLNPLGKSVVKELKEELIDSGLEEVQAIAISDGAAENISSAILNIPSPAELIKQTSASDKTIAEILPLAAAGAIASLDEKKAQLEGAASRVPVTKTIVSSLYKSFSKDDRHLKVVDGLRGAVVTTIVSSSIVHLKEGGFEGADAELGLESIVSAGVGEIDQAGFAAEKYAPTIQLLMQLKLQVMLKK